MNTMKLCQTLPLILISVIASLSLTAQDNHYSWMQYGSRNSLLYNAGLSRFEDQSAVIMNPATLSEAAQSSFNFNTNVVGYNNIKFQNGLGDGFTVKSNNLNVLPSMASGVFKPKTNKKWVMGYALYHANADILDFSDRTERKIDLINEAEGPGQENYLAQYNLKNSLDEFTVVAGLGWKINDKLSVGVSQSFIYRTQKYRESFAAYALTDPPLRAPVDLVGSNIDNYVQYNALITYTKLGLTYRTGKWDLGLTVSSPTLGLMGKGEILADLSLSNIRISRDLLEPRRNYLANGHIQDLKASYKYPVNVSLGASRLLGNVRLYGGLQWYGSVGEYTVLDPGTASFAQPPSADNVLLTRKALRVWSANKSVVNGSLAVDWRLKNDNHMLFSFRTDNHYANFDRKVDGNNLAVKQWNNYHFTIGNQREFKSSTWIYGVRFNYGKNNAFPQPVSFTDPSEGNLLQGEAEKGTITSFGVQLMVSYTFKYNKL
jgi:hypothetical protein